MKLLSTLLLFINAIPAYGSVLLSDDVFMQAVYEDLSGNEVIICNTVEEVETCLDLDLRDPIEADKRLTQGDIIQGVGKILSKIPNRATGKVVVKVKTPEGLEVSVEINLSIGPTSSPGFSGGSRKALKMQHE